MPQVPVCAYTSPRRGCCWPRVYHARDTGAVAVVRVLAVAASMPAVAALVPAVADALAAADQLVAAAVVPLVVAVSTLAMAAPLVKHPAAMHAACTQRCCAAKARRPSAAASRATAATPTVLMVHAQPAVPLERQEQQMKQPLLIRNCTHQASACSHPTLLPLLLVQVLLSAATRHQGS